MVVLWSNACERYRELALFLHRPLSMVDNNNGSLREPLGCQIRCPSHFFIDVVLDGEEMIDPVTATTAKEFLGVCKLA